MFTCNFAVINALPIIVNGLCFENLDSLQGIVLIYLLIFRNSVDKIKDSLNSL